MRLSINVLGMLNMSGLAEVTGCANVLARQAVVLRGSGQRWG